MIIIYLCNPLDSKVPLLKQEKLFETKMYTFSDGAFLRLKQV